MKTFFRVVEKLLLPVAISLLAWSGTHAANKISEGQLRLTENSVNDRKEEFRRTMQAKYVELFYRDLTSGDEKLMRKSLGLLKFLDPETAGQMSRLAETTPDIPADVRAEAEKTGQEAELFSPLFGYKVGIYFLSGNGGATARANDIKRKLVDRGFSGLIQLYPSNRAFFDLMQVPKALEVRYEPDRETQAADVLVSVLKEMFPDLSCTKRPVVNRTTSFISIFIPIDG